MTNADYENMMMVLRDMSQSLRPRNLTTREYFAAMAMQGFTASMPAKQYQQVREGVLGFRILAETSVAQADALIDALNKESK